MTITNGPPQTQVPCNTVQNCAALKTTSLGVVPRAACQYNAVLLTRPHRSADLTQCSLSVPFFRGKSNGARPLPAEPELSSCAKSSSSGSCAPSPRAHHTGPQAIYGYCATSPRAHRAPRAYRSAWRRNASVRDPLTGSVRALKMTDAPVGCETGELAGAGRGRSHATAKYTGRPALHSGRHSPMTPAN